MSTAELASLSFTDAQGPARLVLYSDSTVQLEISATAQAELEHLANESSTTALKWGTSAIVGLAAIGAALYVKRSKGIGLGILGAAGAAGVGAWGLRRYIGDTLHWLTHPVPVEHLLALPQDGDHAGLTFRFDGGGLRKAVVSLAPGEYDATEAQWFLSSLALAKDKDGDE